MKIASVVTPRVQAADTERFEVSGIAGHDNLAGGLGDGRDQRVVVWSVFWHGVGGQDASGGQIKGQRPAGEYAQHLVVEPAP
ncbi:hypothetical protein [Mycobacterium riyadhense]|uniref:Uncharacterized protein n=1 Tax=Mycobacterium riyadhense TaxID=486698 RepID=A0A653EZ94_9MYCO|nr:hypothetical protein [Mycobacterium riyadhense]VTP02817.1 hypothetical protein BIN_B_04714 [Mycobacterium riyadhense]